MTEEYIYMPNGRAIAKRKEENASLEMRLEAEFTDRYQARAERDAALVAAGAPECSLSGCHKPARSTGKCLAHTVL